MYSIKNKYDVPEEGPAPNCTPEKYGKRVKELREAQKLSQKDLAEAVTLELQKSGKNKGLSTMAISNIEKGKQKINTDYTRAFAKKLDCSSTYLLGYTNKKDGYKGELVTPIQGVEIDTRIAMCEFLEAYKEDAEFCELCLGLMVRNKKERKLLEPVLKAVSGLLESKRDSQTDEKAKL